MNFFTDDRPIIACSTSMMTNAAIAVIRLSGFKSLDALKPFLSISLKKIKPRFSHLTNIVDEKKILDNGLIVFFPDGESYTGENVLEISVHGNLLNVQRILDLFVDKGDFRPAAPGEFTYRALKNKKLSLSQVEGLDMLLNANSSLMLTQGLAILQGELHTQYMRLYDSFLKFKGAIELSIDFSDDVGEEESHKLIHDFFNMFHTQLEALYMRTQSNISSLLSPEMVLVGQTNAGKSSLFNLLVKHNRSIVSPIAGTTRDYVSEVLCIDGTNYSVIDTAGIRESDDEIEQIGINRTFEILKRAFFKILVINPFETSTHYLKKLSELEFDFVIVSHSDQEGFTDALHSLDLSQITSSRMAIASFKTGSIGPLNRRNLKSGPIEPENTFLTFAPIGPKMSGPIEPLIAKLLLEKFKNETAHSPILIERHRICIKKIYLQSLDLFNKISELSDAAILSSEVNIFSHHLSELIGIISPDDVLNSIFANFCIGK